MGYQNNAVQEKKWNGCIDILYCALKRQREMSLCAEVKEVLCQFSIIS